MAGRGAPTFQKRQKEQQRKEKQQLKLERKLERKKQATTETEEDPFADYAGNAPPGSTEDAAPADS